MIRTIAIEVGLFLAPFIIYAAVLWLTRADMRDPTAWILPRVIWLIIAGLLLVIVSFVLLAQFGGSPPGETYIPAHMENGKLIPGDIK